jgi:hypothetical protein
MIIWSGHGYLVAIFVFGASLLMEFGTEAAFNDKNFYQREAWPLALALIIAGALSFFIGLKLNSSGQRRLLDPETNEEVVVATGNHSLFFLKMHWWGPILFVVAVIVFVQRLTGGGGA